MENALIFVIWLNAARFASIGKIKKIHGFNFQKMVTFLARNTRELCDPNY